MKLGEKLSWLFLPREAQKKETEWARIPDHLCQKRIQEKGGEKKMISPTEFDDLSEKNEFKPE